MSAESISGSLKAVSETALGPGKSVRKAYCGSTSSGDRVVALQLKNESMALTLLSYGARVQSLTRDSEDLVLKLDNIGAYEADKSFLGASIGRVTNRIKNATFELDDGQYRVASAASHALHGGDKGFDKHVWGVESVRINDSGDLQASFVRISPDGEAGFPGTVQVTARYTLTDDGFTVTYEAVALYGDTVANLTNHTYFTLASGDENVLETHCFSSSCGKQIMLDTELIPTGILGDVPKDYMTAEGKLLGDLKPHGFDNFFSKEKVADSLERICTISHATNGKKMEVFSDQEGFQIFTGPLEGDLYLRGIAIEASGPVDAPNNPSFTSISLREGEERSQTTVYKFL